MAQWKACEKPFEAKECACLSPVLLEIGLNKRAHHLEWASPLAVADAAAELSVMHHRGGAYHNIPAIPRDPSFLFSSSVRHHRARRSARRHTSGAVVTLLLPLRGSGRGWLRVAWPTELAVPGVRVANSEPAGYHTHNAYAMDAKGEGRAHGIHMARRPYSYGHPFHSDACTAPSRRISRNGREQ